jgi:hypothetical protein
MLDVLNIMFLGDVVVEVRSNVPEEARGNIVSI